MKERFDAPKAVATANVIKDTKGGAIPKAEVKVADVKPVAAKFTPMMGGTAEDIVLPKNLTIKSKDTFRSTPREAFDVHWGVPTVNLLQLKYTMEEIRKRFLQSVAIPATEKEEAKMFSTIVETLVFEDGAKYMKAILKKHVLLSKKEKTFLLEAADNRAENLLDLDKIPAKLKALMMTERMSLDTEGTDLFVMIDPYKMITNIIVPGIFAGCKNFADFTKISEIKKNGSEITFVLVIENGDSEGYVVVNSENLVQANLSMSQDKYCEIAKASLTGLDKDCGIVKFVKTSRIYDSNIGKSMKDQMLAMQEGIPLMTCPLVRVTDSYMEEGKKGGNFLLDRYAVTSSTKYINKEKVLEKLGAILDFDVFQFKDGNHQFILPNIKKLTMFSFFQKIRPDFKVSVKTDNDHISIAFSI